MQEDQRIGICGYGRFGTALADLAIEQGFEVIAYDLTAEVPEDLRVDSLTELCSTASVLVLCLPLAKLEHTLGELQPHLKKGHLVLDVGSVKLEPKRAFERVLKSELDWVGTHPLFGPDSLARGERPLRVIICEGSEQARLRAKRLWTRLGCESLEQSSEVHDRSMARSHALAFFVAKGLLKIQAGEGADFTPPSFEAIGQTITAVRSDAGHLFRSIQNDNPFAASERRALIEALEQIDAELELAVQSDHEAAPTDPILEPLLTEEATDLDRLAEVDAELLSLIARRSRLAGRVTHGELSRAEAEFKRAAATLGLAKTSLPDWFRPI